MSAAPGRPGAHVARRPAHRRFAIASVVAFASAAVMAATLAWAPLPPRIERAVADAFLLVGASAALVMCTRAVVCATGRPRLAWIFLTAGACGWTVGRVFWFFDHNFLAGNPAASRPVARFTDACLLAAIVAASIGLLAFPAGTRGLVERLRAALDALVVGAALTGAAALALPTVPAGTPLGKAVLVAYPFGALVFGALALTLLVRAPARRRMFLGVLCLGFLVYAASDGLHAFAAARNATVVPVGWFAGYVALALAAYEPAATVEVAERAPRGRVGTAIGSAAVYGSLLVAVLAALAALGDPAPQRHPGFRAAALAVLVLFGARQVAVGLANAARQRDLDRAVARRTAQVGGLSRLNERILDSVADGLYGVDVDGLVTMVNPAAARLLGYRPEELLGRPAHSVLHVVSAGGAEGRPASGCHVMRALRTGLVVRDQEVTYRRGDGTSVAVEATASPIVDGGRIRGAVVAFHDIGARREADRVRGEFVSMVSQELRAPLTSIRGSLGLLAGGAMGALPEAAARLVRGALRSGERLTRLVDDMLVLDRVAAGTVPLVRADHAAADLIERAVAALRPAADEAGVHLEVGSADGFVHADADRVVQALTNLVEYAVRFSPAGGRVRVSAEAHGDSVLFAVAGGFAADELESSFAEGGGGGAGLGLALCRGIVARHGGRIWADGSVVRFTLPATAVALPAADPDAVRRDDRPMVLAVDDDTAVLLMLTEVLDRRGFRAVTVSRAEEALRVAAADRPVAIVLDLRLPGTSGEQLIADLRAGPDTRDIPIVVLSARSPADDPVLASSVTAWVTKPSDQQTISAAVVGAVGASARPANVLVVEDDDELATVMVSLLARDGLEVRRAATGAAAVAMARQHLPELLILDLDLPDGDGFAVVASLRGEGAMIPVVVYSATDVEPDDRERLRLGPTQFLTKGETPPEDLERRVVSLIGRLAVERQSGAAPAHALAGAR